MNGIRQITLKGFLDTLFNKIGSIDFVDLRYEVVRGEHYLSGLLFTLDEEESRYRIEIEKDLPTRYKCFTLVHEVVHANRGLIDRFELNLRAQVGGIEEYEDQIDEEVLGFFKQYLGLVIDVCLSRFPALPPPQVH